ncbi:MAG: RNA polymerase sigma factor [Bacteroidales bacterium]
MNNNNNISELIELLSRGDERAFDSIYRMYVHRLMGFVLKYVENQEDAKEIVQEVFVKIWDKRDKIKDASTFESFIFTITYNASISHIRKELQERRKMAEFQKQMVEESQDAPYSDIEFKEFRARLDTLIAKLTPRQQEVFQLSREEGLSHEQIADKLGISKNTVKNHIVSIINFLKINIVTLLVVLHLCLLSLF